MCSYLLIGNTRVSIINNSRQFAINLYYQGKAYYTAQLRQQAAQYIMRTDSALLVDAKKPFSVVVAIVQAYVQQQCVFPLPTGGIKYLSQRLRKLIISNQQIIPADTALAVATSGSQAAPKIVLLSFENIQVHCEYFFERVALDQDSLWLHCMPLDHIAGLMIIYRCAFANASVLLHQGFHARQVWQDIFHYPVSHISLVPAMLAQLLDIQESSGIDKLPDSLRFVMVGGDSISPQLFQRARAYGWPLLISYGMTEAASTIALGTQSEQLQPLRGVELRIDHNNTLFLKGHMLSRYYLDAGTGKLSECCENGWLKTADQVRLEPGCLSVMGRSDDMIISGGENISPQVIEARLLDAPMIADIAVGALPHPLWGQSIVALVVCRDKNSDTRPLQEWVKQSLPSAYRPRFFITVAEIPRTRTGKINRQQVRCQINHFL